MAKDKGIPLSPKHGVNPSLATCFWCGKPMGVALVGRIRKPGDSDAEAPREACFGLEPCAECEKKFALGVHLVEVTEDGSRFGGNKRFALKAQGGKTMWPTGRWVIMRPEALNGGKAGGKALCDKETMDRVLASAQPAEPSKPAKPGKPKKETAK